MPPKVTKRTNRKTRVPRKVVDVSRLATGTAQAGNDPRYWVCAGTVGAVSDDGEFITKGETARGARAAERKGIIVDVRLEPLGRSISVRYHGIGAGRAGCLLVPVMPGDDVVVLITDGDLNSASICALLTGANATAQIPEDWANDRVLFDLSVPFHVRAPAISLESSHLKLNGRRVGNSGEPI